MSGYYFKETTLFKDDVHIFIHIEFTNQDFEQFSDEVIKEIRNKVINLIYGFHELDTTNL
jgi:hypothetical protein